MTTKRRSKHQSHRRPGRPGSPRRNNRPKSRPTSRPGAPVGSASASSTSAQQLAATQRLVDGLQALSQAISDALADEHPLIFLLKVSQLYAELIGGAPWDQDDDFMEGTFADMAHSEFSGFRTAGYTLSRLVGHGQVHIDESREDGDEFPAWLDHLDQAEITGCWCGYFEDDLDDVLGVGIRFADGREGSLVTITGGDDGRFTEAYLSVVPYADTALTWLDNNPTAAGLSRISNSSARATLCQALGNSDPLDPDGIFGKADWALGRGIIEWVVKLLTQPVVVR